MKLARLSVIVVVVGVMGLCILGGAQQTTENVAVINVDMVMITDPAIAIGSSRTSVMYNLYSPLVYPTEEGSVRPHLAKSWQAVNGDLTHWRFTLQQGVKFHDGSEMTAEDVAFSMDRLMRMGSGHSGTIGKVSASVVVDKYTVDFFLDEPRGTFPETLALFWPLNKDLVLKHIKKPGNYGEFGDYGEEWLHTHDAGAGPYMMTSHIPGVRLEARLFQDYYGSWRCWAWNEVSVEKLVFIWEDDTTTLINLLKRREVDIVANVAWTLNQLKGFWDAGDLHLDIVGADNVTVWMNTKLEPTDDEHFRKAIIYAFDYEAAVAPWEQFGYGETGIYPPRMVGHVPIAPQPRKQDLQKAREELALSKYANMLDKVKVVFHYCWSLPFDEKIGLQLQADMAKLGVKVEVVGMSWLNYSAECAEPRTTPNMSIFDFSPDYYPPHEFYTYMMYHPKGLGSIFQAHWYFEDVEIIQLLEETRAEPDPVKRLAIYKQLQPLIAAHALALFPYYRNALLVRQPYLLRHTEFLDIRGPELDMFYWGINLELKD